MIPVTYYITFINKVYEGYIEFHTMQKAQKYKALSFPKQSVENADLYKLVWNKIMTTHE